MTKSAHIPLVEVTRGNIVESVHYGSLAIAQPDGKIVFSVGDIEDPVFLRSSSKPFQTLAFIERGGEDHYGLTAQEIAIICASHSGTDEHLRVLETLQKKIGIRENMLQCGVHAPFHEGTVEDYKQRGEAFHANHNDCSGKHSGMLAFAKMIDAPLDNYLDPAHPVQQAMLRTFSEMCDYDMRKVELGTDGCSAPVFAVPLRNSAGAYARLCQPDGLAPARAEGCRTITQAMLSHPDMVGGPQRFDTDIMTAANGSLVTKIGAEGFHGIGVFPGKASGFDTSLGITIKISDGDLMLRAGCVAALYVLEQLKVMNHRQIQAVEAYAARPIYNWSHKVIGEIRPSQVLKQAFAKLNL